MSMNCTRISGSQTPQSLLIELVTGDIIILIPEWNIRVPVNTSSDAKVIDEACSLSVSYRLQHFRWRLTEELNVNCSCNVSQMLTDRERKEENVTCRRHVL